jgi:hypothetical protein
MTMMTPLTLFLSFPRRTKHIVILVSFAARCSYLYLIRFFFSLFLLHPTILAVIYKIRRLWATSDSYSSTRTPSPFPQIIKHTSLQRVCVRLRQQRESRLRRGRKRRRKKNLLFSPLPYYCQTPLLACI